MKGVLYANLVRQSRGALVSCIVMLFVCDWHLALLCMIFPPVSYFCAERMKKPVQQAVSNLGVLFILWFGGKNVLGTGWQSWNIAAFTTFSAHPEGHA